MLPVTVFLLNKVVTQSATSAVAGTANGADWERFWALVALWRDLFTRFIGPFHWNARVCLFLGRKKHKRLSSCKRPMQRNTRAGSGRRVGAESPPDKGKWLWGSGRGRWHKSQLAPPPFSPNLSSVNVWHCLGGHLGSFTCSVTASLCGGVGGRGGLCLGRSEVHGEYHPVCP